MVMIFQTVNIVCKNRYVKSESVLTACKNAVSAVYYTEYILISEDR